MTVAAHPDPPAPQTRSRSWSQQRFGGLLPESLVRYRRPLWWQELLIIAAGYGLYTLGRNAVPSHITTALRHGRGVQHLQERLHLDFELTVNSFVAAHEPIAQVLDYYYATLHFVVTAAVMVWLFIAHPRVYRSARTVLFATTIIALLGFYFYPLAPPRLLPQFGYIDTLVRFNTWGSFADPDIAQHSNQYAAMPSLHIGWALWCAIAVYYCAKTPWIRVVAMLYPLGTLLVIVGTANHFLLDAVGGAIALALGFTAQRLLSGHGTYTPARDFPPGDTGPVVRQVGGSPGSP